MFCWPEKFGRGEGGGEYCRRCVETCWLSASNAKYLFRQFKYSGIHLPSTPHARRRAMKEPHISGRTCLCRCARSHVVGGHSQQQRRSTHTLSAWTRVSLQTGIRQTLFVSFAYDAMRRSQSLHCAVVCMALQSRSAMLNRPQIIGNGTYIKPASRGGEKRGA